MANLGRENTAIGKKLIIGEGLKDDERMVCTTNTTCEDLEVLRSNHEEVDTRLLLYAKYATQPSSRIIIQSRDTDVPVLCTMHFGAAACCGLRLVSKINSVTYQRMLSVKARSQVVQARRQGGAMGANAPPTHGPKRSAWKEPKTKEKNAKYESFLLICQRTQHKQFRKHTRGC